MLILLVNSAFYFTFYINRMFISSNSYRTLKIHITCNNFST